MHLTIIKVCLCSRTGLNPLLQDLSFGSVYFVVFSTSNIHEGLRVNKKRVYRLWREEGLKVPDGQHKRRRLGDGENSCTRRRATHPNHVWSYGFVMDLTEDGRRLNMMPVVDEYSRGCLTIEVERSITAEEVVSTLASLFRQRGAPAFIRSDRAGPSSSPEPSGGGWRPQGLEPSTSSRDLLGRTPT